MNKYELDNEYETDKQINEYETDSNTDIDDNNEKELIKYNKKEEINRLKELFNKKREAKDKEREYINNINEISQKKIDIQHELNLIKYNKKKLEEKQTEYNSDYKLYNKFKELKKSVINFEIPELFINKYNLFEKLENENRCTFENFNNEYNPSVIETKFDSLFESNTFLDKRHTNTINNSEFKNITVDELKESLE